MMAGPAAAAPFDHTGLAERARQSFIVPGYARLRGALDGLGSALRKLCQSPSPDQLDVARQSFRKTIAAWARIELIRFGPIARENRFERLFFWPDRKSIGARQIRRLLARTTESVLAPDQLAQKSVAVQGLTALEQVLHGKGADALATAAPQSFRCRFAKSITGNAGKITSAILSAWSDDGAFTRLWRSPGPDNPVYLRAGETTLELIKAYDEALEITRERRIVPAIGMGPKRRVFRPVLWRSGLGMVLIDGTLAGARDLLFVGGVADFYLAKKARTDVTADSAISSIQDEFKLLLRATGELAALERPFQQPTTRGRLIAIGFPLKSLRQRVVARVKAAAGLSIGFNASDGD